MCLAFEMKTFVCEMGLFQKVTTHKMCQNANLKMGVPLFKLTSCMYC